MSAKSEVYAELEIGLHRMHTDAYQVQLRFTNPEDSENQSEIAPETQPADLDLQTLLSLENNSDAYGETLARQLFSHENIRTLWGKIKTAIESNNRYLRVRVMIAPSAPELHGLRWELLKDPESNKALATSEKILFSRFMVSQDWRPVRLRPKTELKALIAVAALSEDNEYQLAAVDGAGEIERARTNLQGINEVAVLGDSKPLTLNRLLDGLRIGVDILYLVCHGALVSKGPIVYLQDENGVAAVTSGAELADAIAGLQQPPRLVVLASCESALVKDGASAEAALAPRLAEAGVPAILAMQGKISMATVEQFMPRFFSELLKDGQIDRALAVARGEVRSNLDSWMPVLFLRLRGGRIWYVPGFAGDKDKKEFDQMSSICDFVESETVVPIIGPDLTEHIFGAAESLAEQLALSNNFPLSPHQSTDLAKVTQYISTRHSIASTRVQVKNALFERLHKTAAERIAALPADLGPKELMQLVIDELLKDETDPCRILAELPAKVYVSASASPLIERVLETQGKTPIVLVSEWRDERRTEQVFHGDTKPDRPYVYYVYGDIRDENTWVLTEDNFFDYLIRTSLYHELMPPVISKALTQSCLLFLGFRLDDWTFRILFRMIMAKGGSANLDSFNHVGVQVDPDEHTLADAERAKDYLQRYFVNAKIDIYWGSAADFLRELNKTLKKRKQTQSQKPAAPVQARGEW